MSDVISIAIEKWPHEKLNEAEAWLTDTYGPNLLGVWYIDHQPLCVDLVMRKDIYFMFLARFGQDYATS